ncbi:M23 family metallopeptidase [Roseivirga misakiensis]|uniref:M23ase beta-sheet core domain-containing protein n=1 Tax=Roseivirga misakiensis TaxID=1563681 RepID=A0A1E5T110_9BACT|nr:M23 family metallopeptidase [Roseivirga misakiensis]OEK05046.1 hypothetical protein BFP71_16640 [Roseivirga misakiensis]
MRLFSRDQITLGCIIGLFILSGPKALAWQDDISFEARSQGDTMRVFITNPKPYKQTVSLKLQYSKMTLVGQINSYLVIPPNTIDFVAAKFFMNDRAAATINWQGSQYFMGDIFAKHDDTYIYTIPYRKGASFTISKSEQVENQVLRIAMPEDTEIRAGRDGLVLLVRSDSETGCAVVDCAKFANYIVIEHKDGTMAVYSHLRKDGVTVKPGDQVKAGDTIGFSGNTGWTSTPQLRFEVLKGNETIQTKFRLSKKATGYLEHGVKYKSR